MTAALKVSTSGQAALAIAGVLGAAPLTEDRGMFASCRARPAERIDRHDAYPGVWDGAGSLLRPPATSRCPHLDEAAAARFLRELGAHEQSWKRIAAQLPAFVE